MEAILENIPTGVISLTSVGRSGAGEYGGGRRFSAITRARRARCTELLGEEAARAVLHLMRRSLRMGAASREIEIATAGQAGAHGGDGEFARAAAIESGIHRRD